MKTLMDTTVVDGELFEHYYTVDEDDGEVIEYYHWERPALAGQVGYSAFIPFDTLEESHMDAEQEVFGLNKVTPEEVEAARQAILGSMH